jgi:hypothetical protein
MVCVSLLAAGVIIWLVTYGWYGDDGLRIGSVACAVGLGAIWPLSKWCFAKAERAGAFLSRHRTGSAIACALVAAAASLLYILSRGSGLIVRMHDDHVYMTQAQMMARGRLWFPAYPQQVQPFFDSFYLFMHPVYAGMYQPGTAMMLTPGVWLHLPFWAMPIVASSLAAAIFFLILEELFGGLRAALGVAMMICGYWHHYLATTALSELPLFLSELTIWWAWLRWREKNSSAWGAVMGAAIGYAAITRPLDGLCLATIIAVIIFLEFHGKWLLLLKTFMVMAAAATPFLAVQAIQDSGLTGKWYLYAESEYLKHLFPAGPLGFFHLDFSRLPADPSPEKIKWLRTFVLPMYKSHTFNDVLRGWYPTQLQNLVRVTLPNQALLALLPAGLLSLSDIRRRALIGCIAIYVIAYACVVFFPSHYLFPLTLSMTCLVFMSWDALQRTWPARRAAIGGFLFACIAVLTVADLPLFNSALRADSIDFHDREQLAADQALAHLPRTPAVVLFRFDPICDPHDEPVYNDDVAWPDDALVVRVHDLGPEEDRKLIDYYARTQPNRVFYIYDRAAIFESRDPLSPPLGTAAQLAHPTPPAGAY